MDPNRLKDSQLQVAHDVVERLTNLAELERNSKHTETVNVLQSAILVIENGEQFQKEESARQSGL